jgi:isopentenyl phosphate kinase
MLTFLKLGGSLITDKTIPYTYRAEIMDDIARQLADAMRQNNNLQLVLGHGSGSFGHQAAGQFNTRQGVKGKAAWLGFTEVWFQASELNRLVIRALRQEKLPVITLSPAAMVTCSRTRIRSWDITPIKQALGNGLIPVIHGDVNFDLEYGGTILSTEDQFTHLAPLLKPQRILLAGMERGIWRDFPKRQTLIRDLTPGEKPEGVGFLGPSDARDVTGGMKSKVLAMMDLVEKLPGLEVLIFSGLENKNIQRALHGESPGTRLHR